MMMRAGAVRLQRSARTVITHRCHSSSRRLVTVAPTFWNQQRGRLLLLFSTKALPGDEPSPDESEQWEARLTEALKQAHHDESIAPEIWTLSLEEVRDCHVNLGHWEDAIAIEKKLLEVAPKQTREQADCYHRLGSLELQMQHFAEARRYYHLALAIFYDIHGQDSFHRDMGKMLVGLGGICVHQGDSPELALPLLAQAEEHYRNHGMSVTTDNTTIKPDSPHPEISVVLGNQALIHRMMGQHQVAIEKYKEMLVFLHQYESDNEEKRDHVQLQIADCLFAVNQLSPALHHFETLLENVKRGSRQGGEDETETTATTAHEGVLRHHIGVIYSKQGRMEDALRELESAFVIKKKVLGEMHPDVASTLNGLGAVHASLGNDGEALSYFRESLMIARIHAGKEGDKDPLVMQTLRNISLVHGNKVPKWN